MSACILCKKYTGATVYHGDAGCEFASSVLCRRCHHRGHLASMCTEAWPQWERPTTLEELIPADLKLRFGIGSSTPLVFNYQRGIEGSETELGDINEIVVPEGYAELKEFIDKHNIKVEKVTKESRAACMKAVRAWGVSRGYRIVVKSGTGGCADASTN